MRRWMSWAAMAAVIALTVPAGVFAGGVKLNKQAFDRVMMGDPNGSRISVRFDEPEADKDKDKEGHHKASDGKPGTWGGFGGPMIQYFQLDVSPLEPMTRDRKIDNFNNQLVLVGGVGGLIHQDFRFGGFGFGYQDESTGRVAADHRRAKLSFGGGGLLMEYNHTVNSNVGLLAGAMLGAGKLDFKATGLDMGPGKEWKADGNVFLAYPYLGLWLAPAKFFWVQFDAGYLFFDLDTGGAKWDNQLGVDMIDGNVSGGFQASLKLNFGYNPAQ